MAELSGRTALITGAGQNVGAETARVLAGRGARVIVNDLFEDRARQVVSEITAAGGTAEPAVCDVTDLAAVKKMAAAAGDVDILVNNAGIPVTGFSMLPFAEEDPSRWKAFIDLNVYGPLNCTYAVLPGMIARGWGRVITITAPPAATVGTSIATRTDGGDDPVRRRQLIAAGLAIPLSVLASLDDALALLPSPASAATAPEITARLERARKCFDASDLARLIAGLPGLIAAAHQAAENGTDPAGWGRVGACYDLATETLNKIGSYGSSRVTADRATTYAALSGSPIAMSAAARSLGIVLRHEGRHAIADQVTLQAASRLETTGLTTPAQFAAFSQMLCTCAYNAAQAGDRDRALELITDAERAAARLPPHAVPGQPFTVTPAQVALYKVGVHWSLGDAGTAIAAGRDLRPAQFPTAERRGRLHTDLARAWWQWGKPEPTARELLAALRQAPGEVRDRPSIRKVAVSLIQQHPRVPGVRELAAAIGRPESGDHLVRRQ
jgi:NAD(P)-dependent dehydrogenase (short-subunit alcohol dehydrogenase family)